METEARQIAGCLPAETIARIEELSARLGVMENPGAAIDASTPEVGAARVANTSSPIPNGREDSLPGNVIAFMLRKRMATAPQRARPGTAVVIHLSRM